MTPVGRSRPPAGPDLGWRQRQGASENTFDGPGASGVQNQSTIGFNNADLVIDDIPSLGFTFSVELPA